jgi:hypothetical protein
MRRNEWLEGVSRLIFSLASDAMACFMIDLFATTEM